MSRSIRVLWKSFRGVGLLASGKAGNKKQDGRGETNKSWLTLDELLFRARYDLSPFEPERGRLVGALEQAKKLSAELALRV
ncbi:hypothetical protein Mapa_006361 [Marchantia paleacea]|nr:hypothetical protein Mapa_006361 [Marchantia paleacea]